MPILRRRKGEETRPEQGHVARILSAFRPMRILGLFATLDRDLVRGNAHNESDQMYPGTFSPPPQWRTYG